ncbi:LPS assembly protein LptD [Aliiglaciecola sp. CAU 1673]|uniref:LPS-assembly protein LptD n=1 Tax=Aliiglaciecola sp. CAU 1673 TaxID=3032595 RepID=UPI0023DA6C6D|nr:LPS assembly protein LptD [Aliiglaciecola sp. CAU 1673]MDF2176781.1 LPS assembly protein LptD [Aliiglaciecola sp. CAU 1673]
MGTLLVNLVETLKIAQLSGQFQPHKNTKHFLMNLRRAITLSFWLFPCVTMAQQPICLAPVENVFEPMTDMGDNIMVKAQKAEIQQDTQASFSGNVEINSSSARIKAQQAKIDKDAGQLTASGKIGYLDQQIRVDSEDILLDFKSGELNMQETQYRMLNFNGRGQAGNININGDNGISLNDLSFTTCPKGAEDWRIEASSLTIEPGDMWGTVRHTRFYLGDVPVMYLPYFKFPVTDQRQTGLLFPEVSTSDRVGVSYAQPFYWNLAPNYDATITPRLMTDRGVQLQTEFRYLTEAHRGQVDLEYLDADSRYEFDDARYFYRLQHLGELDENWQVSADYNGLSDDNYIVDLGSDYYSRADTHLYQNVGLNYFSNQLNFSAEIRDFEIIGNHPNSYRAIPELRLQYRQPLLSHFKFSFNSELAYFDNGDINSPTATRFHVAPTLSLPLANAWGELVAETSLLQTFYWQDVPEASLLSETVSRTIGQGRLYGAINLERQTRFFGEEMTQTLEPKFQYLYTTYENQDDIGLYDTNRLLNDYIGLFRGQEFTGLDRISDSNHLTLGVATRFVDQSNREQLRLSVGQIFYFSDSELTENERNSDRSALAAEVDWRLSSKWFLHSEVQLSSSNQKVDRSNLSLDYQIGPNRLVQINHRYVRDISGEQIDQFGLTASWPIADRWQWVGRWYEDVKGNRSIETFTGIQYESCCWAIQLVAQRNLSNRFDALGERSENEFESGIALQFVLKGLGGSRNARSILNQGLFGYRQPYFLNN